MKWKGGNKNYCERHQTVCIIVDLVIQTFTRKSIRTKKFKIINEKSRNNEEHQSQKGT